ncbi:MAG: DHHA1 domain-containing protein [Candidatus Nanoarchaeia archaeon]
MNATIRDFVNKFISATENRRVQVLAHFDTDGITSAAIISKTLQRLNKQFSIKILKQLDKKEIGLIKQNQATILVDLGSANLEELSESYGDVFIIDHHEISGNVPKNISIINPHVSNEIEEMCSAELSYIFSKEVFAENQDLAYLAIIGMIGDTMEKEINKTRNMIINDAKIIVKKGILIYPSTRPLDKALEFSSRPFIPGVTGNIIGTRDLLNESGIERISKNYKALIDLDEEEMKKLTTAILLRLPGLNKQEFLGNLYLIKMFNKLEDAREVSAIINACSRMDQSSVAFMLCMGNYSARKKAERIYFRYRQHIISGLKFIEKNKNIHGREYVIINAKDNVKDTIIGTLASILSFSSVYKEGTIIIAMAYNENNIKVSTRIAGRSGKLSSMNLKELMSSVTSEIGGDSGGHKNAAGCLIHKDNENKFIEFIQKKLEFELIKI